MQLNYLTMFPRFHATKRYELLEIQIPTNSTQTKFNIPDQPQLRTDQDADVIIQAIEAFNIADVNPSPNNVPVVSAAFMLQTFLTLYVEGEESLYRIPLNQLHREAGDTAGNPFVYGLSLFKNLQVDWTKSYFSSGVQYAGGVFASFSFLLGVHYYKLPPGTADNIRKAEEYNLTNVRVGGQQAGG
jgi:hypothetical protein